MPEGRNRALLPLSFYCHNVVYYSKIESRMYSYSLSTVRQTHEKSDQAVIPTKVGMTKNLAFHAFVVLSIVQLDIILFIH
jgi:hypothetical protein